MQTVTSETESKSLDLSICVHHYTLRAPCPKGQGMFLCVFRSIVARPDVGRAVVVRHGSLLPISYADHQRTPPFRI